MMKRALFVFLVVCTLSSAMVPRLRRALNMYDEEYDRASSSTSENNMICAPHTPCGWSTYNKFSGIITMNITNTYCSCDADSHCQIAVDDETADTFILKCQPFVAVETAES